MTRKRHKTATKRGEKAANRHKMTMIRNHKPQRDVKHPQRDVK